MNDSYDGQLYVCPGGTEEWQSGYRDAMTHSFQSRFFIDFDDPASDYAAGYRHAIRDICDHDEQGRHELLTN